MKKTVTRSVVVVKVLGKLLFLYGLLGWIYGVAMQFQSSESITYQLSHLTPWLRVDTFSIISFIMSAAGFFMWRLAKELTDP